MKDDLMLLSLENVSYSYPHSEKKALRSVTVSIQQGEYIAVLGCNGSGKSTLARLMAGFFEPSEGTVRKQEGLRPGIVFQQPKEQIVAGIVERDTAFGPQNLSFSKDEIELRTIECLSVVSLADKAFCRTLELSLGQTQRLAFSGILALFPDLLILDEVTAMLDPEAKNRLLEFIGRWNRKGHAVVHVTHDLDEAMKASRIIVMDGGAAAFDGTRQEFAADRRVFESVFGQDAEYTSFACCKQAHFESAETALKVSGLSFCYGSFDVFKEISFGLKKGTLTALTGPSGCGKSTLFECLAGLKKACAGTAEASSRPVLALQESEASLFEPYAADDVAFGPKNRNVCGKELLARVKGAMELSGLPYSEFANRATFSLSGGEKRKLSIAGLIALDSSILIFDEPTAGLDPASRKKIISALRSLAESGKTVLFSTHRIQEAAAADVHLRWEELLAHKNSLLCFAEEKEAGLKKMELIKNASLLGGIARAASVFTAPAKIPSSVISSLPAAAKMILFLALFAVSLSVTPLWACVLMILVNGLYAAAARLPFSKPLMAVARLFPWIVLFSLMGIFLFPVYEGDTILFSWKMIVVTRTKLLLFARSFFHSVSALFAIGTFIFSTDERQIMDGFSFVLRPLAVLKIPVRYAVISAGIMFRFVPLLLEELSGIIKTQIIRGAFADARGIKKIKMMLPVFVPLVLQTVRKAQCLADALTARYFK